MVKSTKIRELVSQIRKHHLTPLDLLPHNDLKEKLVELSLKGAPDGVGFRIHEQLEALKENIDQRKVDDAKVVVFGGGSGLSNVIGGDSRSQYWSKSPFYGLKETFPHTKSIVCVTDDGGSTGEILKQIPLIAVGDIRHVLLSSVQLARLQKRYDVTVNGAKIIAASLFSIVNYRFLKQPKSYQELIGELQQEITSLPEELRRWLTATTSYLFEDSRLECVLTQGNCLGNLLIISTVYQKLPKDISNQELARETSLLDRCLYEGLSEMALFLGVAEGGVMPCTSTPAQLRVKYSNGVQLRGESKSGSAMRGFPVENVFVDYCGQPRVFEQVIESIEQADILVMAPGSLYSSIIPIFQVPEIVNAVKNNTKALKILISNLWVQSGETDLSFEDPERKYRVSDMLAAYESNIPAGIVELFDNVLCLSLQDVPASILQRYAVEGKAPIYLDKDVVLKKGYLAIECGIYSKKALDEQGFIQHDPHYLAKVIKTLYALKKDLDPGYIPLDQLHEKCTHAVVHQVTNAVIPSLKFQQISERVNELEFVMPEEISTGDSDNSLIDQIIQIIWKHQDIPLSHLKCFSGIQGVTLKRWHRDQRWDNIFSFYDPFDRLIKIRQDLFESVERLELALLIAIGQSLLGKYFQKKETRDITEDQLFLGKVYSIRLAPEENWNSHFTFEQLVTYLKLARMRPTDDPYLFTRLVNGDEGFTPPGLLMGLLYVWYLDNRLSNYLEYKMSILKIEKSPLIPEQKKMSTRRELLIQFLRDVVFCSG